jgi:hypothetical protein
LPSCHSSASRTGDLVLERAVAYDELVGRAPDNAAARAAGLSRVAAGNLASSFLLKKLSGELAPEEGERMPLDAGQLEEADIERIRAWIAAGAPPR